MANGNQFKFSLNATKHDFAATQAWLAVQETLRILKQVIHSIGLVIKVIFKVLQTPLA